MRSHFALTGMRVGFSTVTSMIGAYISCAIKCTRPAIASGKYSEILSVALIWDCRKVRQPVGV
jgi:hypothetical protein